MMTVDNRPYAKLSELKAGDRVELEGFNCAEGEVTIAERGGQLYFPCEAGEHFLFEEDGCVVGVIKIGVRQ